MKKIILVLVCLSTLIVQGLGGIILESMEPSVKAPKETQETTYHRDNFDERGSNFEGDILVSPMGFSGAANPKYRWQNARIPFIIDSTFTNSERSIIKAGMEDITSNTCIRFIERTTENDHIFIKKGGSGSGCSSHVGKQGGMQTVTLQIPGCATKGIVSHELIHAIGFRHEHSRTDRDNYITVNYENINPKYAYAFNKYGSDVVNSFGVPYDYGSIMHYSPYAFSTGSSKPTITTKQAATIGQRQQLSPRDKQKINNMYQCVL